MVDTDTFPNPVGHFGIQGYPPFPHRRSARIKKLIWRKLLRMPKNLGVDTFLDPVGHFGAPWRSYWILQAVRRCRQWASAPFAARLVLIQLSFLIFQNKDKKFKMNTWFGLHRNRCISLYKFKVWFYISNFDFKNYENVENFYQHKLQTVQFIFALIYYLLFHEDAFNE